MPVIEKSRSGSGMLTQAGTEQEAGADRLVAGHTDGGLDLFITRSSIPRLECLTEY
jgi:hypothetical protein